MTGAPATVETSQARKQLGTLIQRAAAGVPTTITYRGVPAAQLIPVAGAQAGEAQTALTAINEILAAHGFPFGVRGVADMAGFLDRNTSR